MKNHQETALSNIWQAIFRVFGAQQLPKLPRHADSKSIAKWKKEEKVIKCHEMLFQRNDDGLLWSAVITREAFNETTQANISNYHLAFTLSVCDIILDPKSRGIICNERAMTKHMDHYLV